MKFCERFSKSSQQKLKQIAKANNFEMESVCKILIDQRIPVETVNPQLLRQYHVKELPPPPTKEESQQIRKDRQKEQRKEYYKKRKEQEQEDTAEAEAYYYEVMKGNIFRLQKKWIRP